MTATSAYSVDQLVHLVQLQPNSTYSVLYGGVENDYT